MLRFVYVPVTFEQIGRSCAEVTASLEITLSASGDTLNLATESTACFAGNSPNTPGSLKSWGNPVADTGRWTVESGTGSSRTRRAKAHSCSTPRAPLCTRG